MTKSAETPKPKMGTASSKPIKKKPNKKITKMIPANSSPRKRGRPRKDEQLGSDSSVRKSIKPAANKLPKISIKSEYLDLTDREERFCREYVCDAALNATRAYLKAFPNNAYNSAKTEACNLLTKPYIKARVKEMQIERASRLELTAQKTLEEMAKIAFYDPADFFYGDGRIKPISEMEPDHRAAIAGFETLHRIIGEKQNGIAVTTKIKLPDKRACLEVILRYLKLLHDGTPAPAKIVGEMLRAVGSGGITAREAAFQLQIDGIAIPEILKIEMQHDQEEGDGYDPGPTSEELERRYLEGIAATEKQRIEFLPIRQQEVAELKESLAYVDSFKPE